MAVGKDVRGVGIAPNPLQNARNATPQATAATGTGRHAPLPTGYPALGGRRTASMRVAQNGDGRRRAVSSAAPPAAPNAKPPAAAGTVPGNRAGVSTIHAPVSAMTGAAGPALT